ncbi:MAG: transglutaminase-like cysteine peptidase [Pseudomonas sp.]|uniref:transglutaminase-like cysteine peptidase n=1 Tax=Pseudomonas sp. TaxID=306 RepID=UPI00273630FB|nr:transglutaminase-like cysteine peptidase [Pseudomonas sp.]MDP3848477.1 transglutaminase-like cysteine peptidase [Pseudomonas sp.]
MPRKTAISRSARALRRSLSAWALCLLSTPVWADLAALNASQLPINAAQVRLNNWQQLISNATTLSNAEKLRAVNQLINNSLSYVSDQQAWGQTEYWATPTEALLRGQGDCEDFAIAKYFSLLKMGISAAQLRLMHVKALSSNSPHMVLACYPSPQSEPLLLDNLTNRILPANRRKDLLAVYAFNAEGIYLAKAPTQKIAQPVTMLSRWVALNARMHNSENAQPVL